MQMFVDDLYLYFPIGVPPAICMSKPIWTTDVCGLHQTIQSIIDNLLYSWVTQIPMSGNFLPDS